MLIQDTTLYKDKALPPSKVIKLLKEITSILTSPSQSCTDVISDIYS